MARYWLQVIALFEVLGYFAKKLDKNGLEMYFTVSTDKMSFSNTTGAVLHLKNMRQTTFSNINVRLQHILGKYQARLSQQRERKGRYRFGGAVKPLSLYVFTDGAWQSCDAVPPIEAMIERQKQLQLPKEQVSIQFIRFGDDPDGIKKLNHLDSGLRKKHTKLWYVFGLTIDG